MAVYDGQGERLWSRELDVLDIIALGAASTRARATTTSTCASSTCARARSSAPSRGRAFLFGPSLGRVEPPFFSSQFHQRGLS
ncbi:MAG: hypothetical protein ACR2NB_14440 [Solirubrobacteraceae bacterium]